DSFEDGDEDSPIWYIGYKSTPGDITSRYYNYGDGALDPNEMPLLDGGSRTNSDGAITIANHPYNILKNIQVTRYRFGFYNNNSFGVIFENCIIKDLGDWPSGNYGLGFLHMGNASNCRVINCLAINAEDMLYKFQGNHHLILNNEGFCDDSDFEQSTDYYMNFNAGSSYNIIKGNYLKRVVSGAIVGHGLNIYGDGNGSAMSKYNLILDQTSINFGKGMELRHDGVAYNIIRGLECYEEGGVSGNCVEIRDGAHDNIFENAYIHDLHNATQWSGSTESGTGSGYNNIFNNCIFENFQALNAVSGAFDNPEVAGNLYQNCTIVNTSSQGEVNENSNATTSSGNEFVNCIFENVQALGSEEGYSYTHCNFHNSFSAPSGVSISNHDPMFVDASNSNYRLQGGSPLIDIGTTVSDLYLDFDNNDRFQGSGMDLGAFEFNLNVSSTEQMVTSYEYDVFPNPSKGIFNLTVNKVPVQVQIFDLSGRLVSQEFINQKNSMINLEGQKNGFYLMEIHGFDTHSQTKLILSSN
ncbi:MAG: T9SS type A sorting domain-containing protein, partial [Flavobacteriales bacterium]|nr:T9SS type A sorting domain-containing protein [Flavobacteriales bacterium]